MPVPSAATARSDLLRQARAGVPPGSDATLERFDNLLGIVEDLESCVIALSGGVDSSFLLAVAAPILGGRCLAITADSAAVPQWDRNDAGTAARAAGLHGARWRTVATSELDEPRYASNPRSRCYYCKLEVYGTLAAIARDEGIAWVVDGTNASDQVRTDRPGMAAAGELGVRSPLVEAGIGKSEIRLLARAIGLPDWDRPASACLSSRIPFGVPIRAERLRLVEAAELALRGLGLRQVRVRDFGSSARVEVDAAERDMLARVAPSIGAALTDLGFEGWTAADYTGTGAGDRPKSGAPEVSLSRTDLPERDASAASGQT